MRRSQLDKRRQVYYDLVRQRMTILYNLACNAARQGDLEYARRLGLLIRRLHLGTRVKPPRYIKRGLCRHCYTPLIPGLTARVRLRTQGRRFSYKVIVCKVCGWIHRYPYKSGLTERR